MPTECYSDEDITALEFRVRDVEERLAKLDAAKVKPAPLLIWRFHEAPEELRALSTYGGDEDWLAELPPSFDDDTPDWLYRLAVSVSADLFLHDHPTKPGWKVCIVAHA